MNLEFDPNALEDLRYWVEADRKKALKILKLIESLTRSLFEGPGKPEPLKYDLSSAWSRRIDQEHRLVYRVDKNIRILSCRYHY
jgi:toxin YoeB